MQTLLDGVAVQYHWILDESVLYLGESEGRAKYKQDESNIQCYWMATHPMRNLLYILHTTHDPTCKWPVHQAIQYHWTLDGLPYRKCYIISIFTSSSTFLRTHLA